MNVFKFAKVWKFKYTNAHGQPDCMITLDEAKALEWSGRRDGILVKLFELEEECTVKQSDASSESQGNDGCVECVSA